MTSLNFLISLLLIGVARSELFDGPPSGRFYRGFGVDDDIYVDEESQAEMIRDHKVPANIGNAVGVTLNKQGNLVIFHRADRVWHRRSFSERTNMFNSSEGVIQNNTIMVIDPTTGNVLGEYGHGLFYLPHGIASDSEGNYWVTDVGRHQVIKLDKDFKPIMALGEKMIPGEDDKHFCKPTDVAIATTGEVFIADGYCNSRIVKYSADGRYLGAFGTFGNGDEPANGEFFIPHSLTLVEDMNLLCVADRENQRIQCFTAGLSPKGAHQRAVIPTGTFVTKAENIGRIMALRESQHYLVGVTNTEPYMTNGYQIFIMDMNTQRATTIAKDIPDAHALAVSSDGDIYVAQLNPSQVMKFSVPTEAELEEMDPLQ